MDPITSEVPVMVEISDVYALAKMAALEVSVWFMHPNMPLGIWRSARLDSLNEIITKLRLASKLSDLWYSEVTTSNLAETNNVREKKMRPPLVILKNSDMANFMDPELLKKAEEERIRRKAEEDDRLRTNMVIAMQVMNKKADQNYPTPEDKRKDIAKPGAESMKRISEAWSETLRRKIKVSEEKSRLLILVDNDID